MHTHKYSCTCSITYDAYIGLYHTGLVKYLNTQRKFHIQNSKTTDLIFNIDINELPLLRTSVSFNV